MKDLILTKRMEAVVNMVSPQSFAIADIGCDHAYVSAALIKRQLTKKVFAMDVRTGPLTIAEKNVELYGLTEKIELRLSDGLDKLRPGEADTIIIAGMGGILIKSILERGREILFYERKRPVLILQPQSDVKEVRIFLYENEYHIVREKMLIDEGKYYTVIKAVPGKKEGYFLDAQWVYGKYNLEQKDTVLHCYLQKQKQTLKEIQGRLKENIRSAKVKEKRVPDKTIERSANLMEELKINAEALKYYMD